MDYMVRAVAANDQVRAFAICSRDMVEQARQYHNTSPVATAALGRTLTGGVMMGSMMKNEKDVLTIQVRGDGPLGGICVTADANGHAKGYVNNPMVLIHANDKGKLDVGGAVGHGFLQVIKDMGLKEPFSGTSALVTGEIAEDLTNYFVTSEQVPSAVGLGVLMNKDNEVDQAGGFIIQLMPFAEEEVIDKLEKKLSQIPSVTTMLKSGMTPEQILEEILGEFGVTFNETMPVSFQCDCSKDRYARALASIGAKDLQEMIDEGNDIETECHFCGKKYTFSVDELKAILERGLA